MYIILNYFTCWYFVVVLKWYFPFEDEHSPLVRSMEQALLKTANGDAFECEVAVLKESCYKHCISWANLSRQIYQYFQISSRKLAYSYIKVMPFHTACDHAMNINSIFTEVLPIRTAHQLLHLCKTILIMSTSKGTFFRLVTTFDISSSSFLNDRV